MILTTYRIEKFNTGFAWVLTEGISGPEKKVVIHEYKPDGVLGWASQFATLDRALKFWDCLEENDFDPERALVNFKKNNAPD